MRRLTETEGEDAPRDRVPGRGNRSRLKEEPELEVRELIVQRNPERRDILPFGGMVAEVQLAMNSLHGRPF